MEILRRVFFFVLGAAFASGWWAASVFGTATYEVVNPIIFLWAIPILTTFALVAVVVCIVIDNWNNK